MRNGDSLRSQVGGLVHWVLRNDNGDLPRSGVISGILGVVGRFDRRFLNDVPYSLLSHCLLRNANQVLTDRYGLKVSLACF